MFAHWIWSLLLIAVMVAIYWFVIRPRLQAKITELRANVGSFWGRLLARIYAFRTYVVASVGVLLTAAPDLLVAIAPLDFSQYIGQKWAGIVGIGTTITIALMKAFETKPKDEPA